MLALARFTNGFFWFDAHRDGKRFIVRTDDLLAAFLSREKDAMAKRL
jgi:hypothetical protein